MSPWITFFSFISDLFIPAVFIFPLSLGLMEILPPKEMFESNAQFVFLFAQFIVAFQAFKSPWVDHQGRVPDYTGPTKQMHSIYLGERVYS